MDGEDTSKLDIECGDGAASKMVYLPGQPIEADEELVYDKSAYVMYHQAQTGAPCLSFDTLPDTLGEWRNGFPMSCYLVAGTQAERSHTNNIILMHLSNLHPTRAQVSQDTDTSSESEPSDDDDDDDKRPQMQTYMISHTGCVNRLRSTVVGGCNLVATWSDTGKVHIWDVTRSLNALSRSDVTDGTVSPAFTFSGHRSEGFALDWCSTTTGRLATGDCCKDIHVWNMLESGTWHVDQRPYTAHTASVEDIQWSPNEANVFASCSVDRSIRVWDTRALPSRACMLSATDAHTSDVNVISWNQHEPFLLSAGDDGIIKVWDLRQFQYNKPVAVFKHHTAPISSVEWHPRDSSVFAAAGADDQLTLWDLAVERDEGSLEPDVPPQLLFIHLGQKDIKELHWHKQLNGVMISTALSGFDVFRTISV